MLLIFSLLFINNIQAKQYTFGIVPQYNLDVLKQKWNPLLHQISIRTDDNFVFKSVNSMAEFEKNLESGFYDFAYVNPVQFLKLNRNLGYKPLIKIKGQVLRGIIVTNNTTGFKSLTDLHGKEMAFPYPEAFGAYTVINKYLKKQKIEVIPVFVGSHQRVFESVAAGLYIAGGGIELTLAASNYDIKNKLTVKYSSEAFPPLIIAVHPRVSNKSIQDFTTQLFNMNNNERDRIYLNLISTENFEFEQAKLEDFDSLKYTIDDYVY